MVLLARSLYSHPYTHARLTRNAISSLNIHYQFNRGNDDEDKTTNWDKVTQKKIADSKKKLSGQIESTGKNVPRNRKAEKKNKNWHNE